MPWRACCSVTARPPRGRRARRSGAARPRRCLSPSQTPRQLPGSCRTLPRRQRLTRLRTSQRPVQHLMGCHMMVQRLLQRRLTRLWAWRGHPAVVRAHTVATVQHPAQLRRPRRSCCPRHPKREARSWLPWPATWHQLPWSCVRCWPRRGRCGGGGVPASFCQPARGAQGTRGWGWGGGRLQSPGVPCDVGGCARPALLVMLLQEQGFASDPLVSMLEARIQDCLGQLR